MTKVMNVKLIKESYIKSLESGSGRKESAIACGVCTTTIWNWLQSDKKFSSRVKQALESRINTVEDALFKLATGEERNKDGKIIQSKGQVIAQIFWLKNKGKGQWKDKQEVTFTPPLIVQQQTFIQAGEKPVIKEEEVKKKEDKGDATEFSGSKEGTKTSKYGLDPL